jgi:hypothetical protein
VSPFPGRYQVHRGFSTLVATDFVDESMDFVYLDALHSYRDGMNDLLAWWPKVLVGPCGQCAAWVCACVPGCMGPWVHASMCACAFESTLPSPAGLHGASATERHHPAIAHSRLDVFVCLFVWHVTVCVAVILLAGKAGWPILWGRLLYRVPELWCRHVR